MKKSIFTTLPYINSVPHIGHCFEFVIADITARFFRDLMGSWDVFFSTGVDEHGLKIQQAAEDVHLTPDEYCNKYELIWNDFCEKFQISFNNFYCTRSESHKIEASQYFQDLKEK